MDLKTKTFTPGQKFKKPKENFRIKEIDVEACLDRAVRKSGGITRKWQSPSNRSVHDRICIFPGEDVWLVEVKAPDGKKSPGQKNFHDQLFYQVAFLRSITVWCKEDIEEFLILRRKLLSKQELKREEKVNLRKLQVGRIQR